MTNVSLPDPPASNQGKDEPVATTPSESPQSSSRVNKPGDSKGVSVPSVQAAAGTSEESGEIAAVRTTANAPPGKPDGEVDTRA